MSELIIVNSSAFERIEELKSLISFQSRVLDRIKQDVSLAQSQVDLQFEIMDSLNKMYADTTSYTGNKSPFAKTLRNFDKKNPNVRSTIQTPALQPLSGIESPTSPGKSHDYSHALLSAIDYDFFSREYPLILSYLFERNIKDEIKSISSSCEKLALSKRTDYLNNVFKQLNETSQIFDAILKLVNATSFSELTEMIENKIPKLLNIQRAAIFQIVDSDIVLQRECMKLHRSFNSGVFYNIFKSGRIKIVSCENPDITSIDQYLFMKNQVALVVPIDNLLLLLFDKTGGFKEDDFLIALGISNFIREMAPSLEQKDVERPNIQTTIKIMNNFSPKVLGEVFHCEGVRVFHVSSSKKVFLDSNEVKPTIYSISTGIVGQCITKMRLIRMSKPELSVLFEPAVDRINMNTPTSSIMVSPIFSKDNKVKYVIALYSRKNVDFFTELDENTMKMVCKSLNPIVRGNKLQKQLERKENHIKYLTLTMDIFNLHVDLLDFYRMKNLMNRALSAVVGGDSEVFLTDYFRNDLSELRTEFNEKISETGSPQCISACTGKMMQMIVSDTQTKYYIPLPGNNGQISAVVKLDIDKVAAKAKRIISVYSSVSMIKLDSSSASFNTKSSLQLKVEKMNNSSQAQFTEIDDRRITNCAKPIRDFFGSLCDAYKNFSDDISAVKFSMAIEKIPEENSSLYVRAHEDLSALIGTAAYGPTTFIQIPVKNENFQKVTATMLRKLTEICGFPDLADPVPTVTLAMPSKVPEDLSLDIYNEDAKSLLSMTTYMLFEFGIEEVLDAEDSNILFLLKELRGLHSAHWEVAVDNVHFAYLQLKQMKVENKIEALSLMFYLLCYSANKIETTGAVVQAIETGTAPSPSSILLYAAAASNAPFLEKKEWFEILEKVSFLSSCESFDSLGENSDTYCLLAILSKRSCLARKFEVAERYVKERFSDQVLMKYILEAEMRGMILPVIFELTTPTFKTDTIRMPMVTNARKITGAFI
ncbi:hypothetical protein TVAG_190570 [Trichomonas vaginalis G3]|uniref:GAF domain-containing protein n=1 Tax=Trichomonas vaginalis (strain ATCC PRA-98 / G3) TaxID=412133 RepID=A2DKI4_TRIV3|nr:GAF domain-like family [Trichomonas vaginalis G3]EAY19161.1 hypothetical protein TVAG_190570 [Trichomonas vaginalis G3]KAI5490459.1 GAF domain-like family [Trichomonas vaginalis G3]|eukprot:XP_001580147.1 hypothetical protein [Trichomonas vaginalis G3]